MQALSEVIQSLMNMGAVIIMPIIILIIGIILRVKPGKALRAGLTVGVGFIGINTIMTILANNLGPATTAMVERFGLSLSVMDVGWPITSAITWGSVIVPLVFVAVLVVNLIMVYFGWTKTMDVDIWNYWLFMFGAAIVYYQTNSLLLGVFAGALSAVIIFLLADWAYTYTKDWMPGVSFPHGVSVVWMPVIWVCNKVIDVIPGLNRLEADPQKIEQKFGVFGEPLFIGIVLGAAVGVLAGNNLAGVLNLAMYMGAVMVLMPKMVAIFMEGISVISKAAQEFFSKSTLFKGKDIHIGIDACVLMGYPGVIATGILIIPVMILISLVLPGNKILPFADLVNLAPWFAFATICSKGNVVRGVLISAILCCATLWIATDLGPLVTQMGAAVGFAFPEGASEISSLCTGNLFVSYVISKVIGLFVL